MKNIIFISIVFIFVLLILGSDKHGSYYISIREGAGIPFFPHSVAAAPAEPHACDVNNLGKVIYIDDTNNGAEAIMCYCGEDADDASYVWLKAEDPTVNCF